MENFPNKPKETLKDPAPEVGEVVETGDVIDPTTLELETNISREEERELLKKVQGGNIEEKNAALEQLIEANKGIVMKLARLFRLSQLTMFPTSNLIPLEDLIQEGYIGITEAAEKFDFEKNNRFMTYGSWYVRKNMNKLVMDIGGPFRIPRKAKQAQDPDAHWGIFSAQNVIRYDHLGPEDAAPEDDEYRKEILGRPERSIFLTTSPDKDPINQDEVEEYVRTLIEKAKLNENEKIVLKLRILGDDEGDVYTLEEIGEKLSLTKERVRQIEAIALARIRSIEEGFVPAQRAYVLKTKENIDLEKQKRKDEKTHNLELKFKPLFEIIEQINTLEEAQSKAKELWGENGERFFVREVPGVYLRYRNTFLQKFKRDLLKKAWSYVSPEVLSVFPDIFDKSPEMISQDHQFSISLARAYYKECIHAVARMINVPGHLDYIYKEPALPRRKKQKNQAKLSEELENKKERTNRRREQKFKKTIPNSVDGLREYSKLPELRSSDWYDNRANRRIIRSFLVAYFKLLPDNPAGLTDWEKTCALSCMSVNYVTLEIQKGAPLRQDMNTIRQYRQAIDKVIWYFQRSPVE